MLENKIKASRKGEGFCNSLQHIGIASRLPWLEKESENTAA